MSNNLQDETKRSSKESVHRRHFLTASTLVTIVPLGGCLDSGDDNGTPTDSPSQNSPTQTTRLTQTPSPSPTQRSPALSITEVEVTDPAVADLTLQIHVTVENRGSESKLVRLSGTLGELEQTNVSRIKGGEKETLLFEFWPRVEPGSHIVTFSEEDEGIRTETQVEILSPSRSLNQRVGATHVAGKYHFTDRPYLWEGADVLETLGMRTIHVYLHRVESSYQFNHEWPDFDNLVEQAQHEYYSEFFEMDFDTFVLTAYALGGPGVSDPSPYLAKIFNHEFTNQDFQEVSNRFYNLASHFYTEYDGTGKEFIIHNWESDWHVIRDDLDDVDLTMLDLMIEWQQARQEGVRRAQEEFHWDSDVTVLHACEVVRAKDAMEGIPRVITHVVPEVNLDLVSYSAWGAGEEAMNHENDEVANQRVVEILDFLNGQMNSTTEYASDFLGNHYQPVYLGELGWQQQFYGDATSLRVVKILTEASLQWGVPFSLYWQVFDNDIVDGDYTGNWLINAQGDQTQFYTYYSQLLSGN